MRYRVWAVNQRGYGRTTRPTQVGDYALPHLVDDVTALINAASAKSVVLIGHDWGAMVAWCFAAEQLHPLERLSGANPSLKWGFRRLGTAVIPRPLWTIIEAEKSYFGLENGGVSVLCPLAASLVIWILNC